MRQVAFDTFHFVEKLVSSGVPEKQAKAHLEVVSDGVLMSLDGLVTKPDLQATEDRLDTKIDTVEARLDNRMDKLEANLNTKIDKLDAKLDKTIAEFQGKFTLLQWMFSSLIAGMVAVLLKLFL